MVKRCIVGDCNNTKREGVSLHSFPTNHVSRKQWIKQIRTTRKDWTEPTSDRRDSQVVCSDHFREDDFDPTSKLKQSFGIKSSRRLLPNAVPCVFYCHITQSACTPNQQKSRVTAGLTTCRPTGAFQKRERARMLKEIFQNQHPEDNVQDKTQTTPITQSKIDGATYPGLHTDVTENFPCISSVQMGLETSCSIAVECQTDRILKRPKRTQAFVRGKQIDFGCQVNVHVQRRSKGIQCSLDIHTDNEMENKIDSFDEPDTDPDADAHDIEDECSMIRESDDSSYKPDESDPMDSSFNSDTSGKGSEQPSTSLMSERKFIVFEEQLLSLFLTCRYCHGPAKGKVTNTFGTLIIVTQECHLCSKSYTWSSQPYLGDMPAGNIILSGAIFLQVQLQQRFFKLCNTCVSQ